MNKYRNKKVKFPDGEVFDSVREANRFCVLKALEKSGHIKDLKRQVRFILIPKQKTKAGQTVRECAYIADFTYTDVKTGETVVEDTKGHRTREYLIKKKLMLKQYGIEIKET